MGKNKFVRQNTNYWTKYELLDKIQVAGQYRQMSTK